MPELLDEQVITTRLSGLPGWERADETIRRKIEAPSFLAGIDLVGKVAQVAEEAGHHPDIDIRWRNITFVLTTHDADGLTSLDFELAERISAILAENGVH